MQKKQQQQQHQCEKNIAKGDIQKKKKGSKQEKRKNPSKLEKKHDRGGGQEGRVCRGLGELEKLYQVTEPRRAA